MEPVGTPIFVDSHTHLDDGQFEDDLDSVLDAAATVGVQHVINIGYRPTRWRSSIELAQRRPDVSFTLGLHPNHADEFTSALLDDLRTLIDRHRPVAIGEIGLDYYRDFADRDAQRHAFTAQLELAAEQRLPVVLHLRGEVEADLRVSLESAPAEIVCVLHSFDGTEDLAVWALDRRYFFGVGGLVTRKDNSRLRDVVRALPMERMLLETDSPYLTPTGIKDRRNSPVNIPVIAKSVSELKEIDIDELALVTTRNARELLRLPVPTIS